MATPTYDIVADAPDELLRLTLTGDWDMAISARFGADVLTTIQDMIARGARPGHFRTLIDMRRKALLPQNVLAEFARMVRPDSPSKRIAMLVSSTIHKMQARRIADDRCRIFDSEEEALAWLLDSAAPPRPWPPEPITA